MFEHSPSGAYSKEVAAPSGPRYKLRHGSPLQSSPRRWLHPRQQRGARARPEAQRAALEAWAKREGVTLAAVFEDRLTGATPIGERAGLMGALTAMRENRAGILVAAKRDRFARDVVETGLLNRAVDVMGAKLRTADGMSNMAGPEGALMTGIVDVFAQYERGLIRARTRAALGAKRAKGERTGEIPYGHRLAADGVHLEADEAEQAVLVLVRELRAGGLSQRGIAAELTRRGLMSRAGSPFGQTQIARILAKAA